MKKLPVILMMAVLFSLIDASKAYISSSVVAYASRVCDDGTETCSNNLINLLDVETGVTQSIDVGRVSTLSWSPSGREIAFDDFDRIYILDTNDIQKPPQRLIADPTFDNVWPQWSPDGTYIAFLSLDDTALSSELWVVNFNSGVVTCLVKDVPLITDVAWSPDSSKIAYVSFEVTDLYKNEIYTVDVNGANLRQITNNDTEELDLAWSPDGRYIAYTRRQREDGVKNIYVMNPDGTNPQYLTPGKLPTWGIDNLTLFYAHDGLGLHGELVSRIATFNLQTKNSKKIASVPLITLDLVISPDKTDLIYVSPDPLISSQYQACILSLVEPTQRCFSDVQLPISVSANY